MPPRVALPKGYDSYDLQLTPGRATLDPSDLGMLGRRVPAAFSSGRFVSGT
jgi:hypothetical protein